MEKHVQIALNNAREALAFIDPWARVVTIIDTKRQKMVLDELNEKYRFYGEDAIQQLTDDLQCIVELRLAVPGHEGDDYPDHHMDYPEFYMCAPRKYNEEYYSYGINLQLHKDAMSACRFKDGTRLTPYTVGYISSHKTTQQRAARLQRLIELDAPKIIQFHEEMSLRRAEYMIDVKLNRLLQDLHEQAEIDAVFVQM